ncbi:hypothetical protein AVEN_99881-1 [Araneus ventricosus]|uniref:Uncharacterized protein n=1 Tax=Araneus ventricosus TaxID=182803 RepID=A0A4Y2PUV6_ARAVE|nr:hypothetical protein AVEN_99881-1 [Araneus ventricosus]
MNDIQLFAKIPKCVIVCITLSDDKQANTISGILIHYYVSTTTAGAKPGPYESRTAQNGITKIVDVFKQISTTKEGNCFNLYYSALFIDFRSNLLSTRQEK